MHEFAAGQDTEKSWPVGMTGFGLGVTDQPRAEALTGTEALAGIPAAPARTTAARRTDTFAAFRPILPSGCLVQNFMITPILQSQFAGPPCRAQRPEGGERGGGSSWMRRPGPNQAKSMSRSQGMPSRSLARMTAARDGPWNRHSTRSSPANSSEPR